MFPKGNVLLVHLKRNQGVTIVATNMLKVEKIYMISFGMYL